MNKLPRVVLLDIETSPIKGYTWGMYEQNVLAVLEPVKVISMAWKWLGEKEFHCVALPDLPGYRPGHLDDSRLIRLIWKVLDEADVAIAHHGDSFDIKKINARFVAHGLKAPSYYKTIDTLKVAKRYFRFDNNTLDQLGTYLNEGKKMNTGGFELWLKCMAGDLSAWDKMKRYNVKDVRLLERVYLRLRPFMADHPNLALIAEAKGRKLSPLVCPSCGSGHTVKRGTAVTRTTIRQRFQCNDCGSWSSGPMHKAKGVTLR